MPDPVPPMPWMNAWLELQKELEQRVSELARMLGHGGDYAGIAADCWHLMQKASAPAPADFAERYQRLFQPTAAMAVPAPPAGAAAAAAIARWQAASRHFGEQVSALALDASRRMAAALAAEGPLAPPITSLRALHELWIDCGEAAFANAAHRDEYADAQAELLASLVELRALQPDGGR